MGLQFSCLTRTKRSDPPKPTRKRTRYKHSIPPPPPRRKRTAPPPPPPRSSDTDVANNDVADNNKPKVDNNICETKMDNISEQEIDKNRFNDRNKNNLSVPAANVNHVKIKRAATNSNTNTLNKSCTVSIMTSEISALSSAPSIISTLSKAATSTSSNSFNSSSNESNVSDSTNSNTCSTCNTCNTCNTTNASLTESTPNTNSDGVDGAFSPISPSQRSSNSDYNNKAEIPSITSPTQISIPHIVESKEDTMSQYASQISQLSVELQPSRSYNNTSTPPSTSSQQSLHTADTKSLGTKNSNDTVIEYKSKSKEETEDMEDGEEQEEDEDEDEDEDEEEDQGKEESTNVKEYLNNTNDGRSSLLSTMSALSQLNSKHCTGYAANIEIVPKYLVLMSHLSQLSQLSESQTTTPTQCESSVDTLMLNPTYFGGLMSVKSTSISVSPQPFSEQSQSKSISPGEDYQLYGEKLDVQHVSKCLQENQYYSNQEYVD